ncbi:uncharacterized protein EV586_10494 [Tumebacillus sp. BK434]|uniref:DUF418 domain-containing protein n=1 Tax=Tumebacillus sp. BK434 TaxID=2512169 RepID=UPI001053E6F6|nr:DUF418 domain-containing protein [Tumebacillus sp. BK434]TCP54476.1 uncharacterized protein EV586_10494 [Tumebacillus sp. BK434]
MTQQSEVKPIQPEQRMMELDVIRGFAILGILIVNMQFFSSAYQYLSRARMTLWTEEGDKLAKLLIDMLVASKFYTMFSFLFGIGMMIFLERARRKGRREVPLFLRRISILLVFGLIHAILIWSGDILFEYAVLAFLLVLFYRARPWFVLSSAFFFLFLTPVLNFLGTYQKVTIPLYQASGLGVKLFNPSLMLQEANEVYEYGTYGSQVLQRIADFVYQYGVFWALFPVVFAMFLFGVYAAKKRIFQNVAEHRTLIRWIWVGSLFTALFSAFYTNSLAVSSNPQTVRYILDQCIRALHNPALCFFYVTSILQLMQIDWIRAKTAPFAAVGRMAISNYLMSSLICTTIFYSYGFGLFNKIGPAKGLLISFLIYPLLMVFSIVWLRYFRYGPVEWLWRSLTYGQLQSMRLKRDISISR